MDPIDDSSLDDICKATLSKIKYIWEPQSATLLKGANKNLNKIDEGVDELTTYRNRKDSVSAIQKNSKVYSDDSIAAPPLKPPKEEKKKTLGKGWFDMAPMELDDKARRDIKILRLRNFIDPKRFYKNPDKMKSVIGMGTVIEGSTEYTSARLTNKERKQSLIEEILHDPLAKGYTRKAFNSIQSVKAKKTKIFSKKQYLKHSGKKAKKSTGRS